ncbi:hypothetical protein CkaCkLH20_08633 [Colletotrichum karsti]|uniref:Uncharacterized protein n=1 Tax=Colletotrichum karsti TaxID=1095194 RepID=A0A9P6LF88_9PEZI|nr:uncharacterized protein CkaCkLH20_08633 [Colletotrichum karsti]KAF9873899.1 hypothetical protein CkaCkLH20_08633 [Colletotrichum karsti]
MPPIRTPKSAPAKRAGGLGAFGFAPVDRTEALSRAAKSTPKAAAETSQSQGSPSRARAPARAKGEKKAHFENEVSYFNRFESRVGSSTKTISFGPDFRLTTGHLTRLLRCPDICKKLWHITMPFKDPDRGLIMSGNEGLRDPVLVALAEKCPALRTIKIPGTCSLSDEVYIALGKNCPNLTNLEIFAGNSCSSVDGRFFDELRENPSWAPKLKKIRMSMCDSDEWARKEKVVRAVKALTEVRDGVTVQFVNAEEERDYVFGGYDVSYTEVTYKNGKSTGSKTLYQFDLSDKMYDVFDSDY